MTEQLLTPSKITAFLDCGHFLTLQRRLESGEITVHPGSGMMARMLMAKGLTHEQACLAHYRQAGCSVYEVPGKNQGEAVTAWVRRIGNPMADGHGVIYQMPFEHDGIRGVADFLVRVAGTDGSVRYEPVDAKLARAGAKPGHILQLCFYAEAIEAITGDTPHHLQVWLGSGKLETVRLEDVRAYWRRLRRQLAKVLATGSGADPTVAEPCNHCEFCEFSGVCEADWRQQDSLVFVANILRSEREALTGNGVGSLAALAGHVGAVEGVRPERLKRHVLQASLQERARQDPAKVPPHELLPPAPEGVIEGLPALPAPDDGDVFLDYEGHPFWTAERGLFFLFGLLTRAGDGTWTYGARWAHDRAGEQLATGQLIQDLVKRRQQYPGMHVYHYNHTERSVLERLAEEYAIGTAEVAGLVRTGLFIDLLAVVTRTLQAGVESYGLKHIEKLAGFTRSEGIDRGAGAVMEYDAYCGDGDPERLVRIARYNQDDVMATRALRDWLIGLRPADLPWRPAAFEPVEVLNPEVLAQVAALHAFPEESGEHLLGDLLGYWDREASAVFTGMIAKTHYDSMAQLKDPEVLAGLEPLGEVQRFGKTGKLLADPGQQFKIPPQAIGRKLCEGGSVVFGGAEGQIGFSKVESIDLATGIIQLAWNKASQAMGILPEVLVLNAWVQAKPKPAALSELATKVLAGSPVDPPSPVAMAILRRALPAFKPGQGPAGSAFTDDLEDMCRWVLQLDRSYVAIQGPPGTGKTYTGAHLIHALVMSGKRVGITAMSHTAIDNLLGQVLEVFAKAGEGLSLRAIRKVDDAHARPHAAVKYTTSNADCANPAFNVVGGTTWLFASEDIRQAPVDVLFIDEAGQLSLADTVAAVGAARNVILLGDPQQLAHVSQGTHPGRAGVSVLEHLLGPDRATIAREQGVFLSRTWRMHPDVCGFISEQFYDGQLVSHPTCAVQTTEVGTGLRWIPAIHTGCSTEAPVEAELLVGAIAGLIGKRWTDAKGASRPLTVADILVVAPYNDQVAQVQRHLAATPLTAGVRVGTVDKFQGQEAPVVFFTMTASTAADVPRGLAFLFSRNRLNVAISRARGLAHIVCTEALLDSRARDVDEMELISTLCAFAECCQPGSGAPC